MFEKDKPKQWHDHRINDATQISFRHISHYFGGEDGEIEDLWKLPSGLLSSYFGAVPLSSRLECFNQYRIREEKRHEIWIKPESEYPFCFRKLFFREIDWAAERVHDLEEYIKILYRMKNDGHSVKKDIKYTTNLLANARTDLDEKIQKVKNKKAYQRGRKKTKA